MIDFLVSKIANITCKERKCSKLLLPFWEERGGRGWAWRWAGLVSSQRSHLWTNMAEQPTRRQIQKVPDSTQFWSEGSTEKVCKFHFLLSIAVVIVIRNNAPGLSMSFNTCPPSTMIVKAYFVFVTPALCKYDPSGLSYSLLVIVLVSMVGLWKWKLSLA